MLRVECEKCKTPFQVDERRVPSTGLPMRCPKCGHNFMVEGPKAAAARLRRAGTSTLIFGTLDDILNPTKPSPSSPPPPPSTPPRSTPPIPFASAPVTVPAAEADSPLKKRANTMPYAGQRKRQPSLSDEPILEVKEAEATGEVAALLAVAEDDAILEGLDWSVDSGQEKAAEAVASSPAGLGASVPSVPPPEEEEEEEEEEIEAAGPESEEESEKEIEPEHVPENVNEHVNENVNVNEHVNVNDHVQQEPVVAKAPESESESESESASESESESASESESESASESASVSASEPEPTAKPDPSVSVATKKPRRSPAWALALVAVVGLALEATPYGAFGRIVISDKLHADEYANLLVASTEKTRVSLGADVFPDAKAAVEALTHTQEQAPRAKGLADYLQVADAEVQLRFSTTADIEKAKALLTTGAGDSTEDALAMRGEIALRAKDAPAALEAFTRTLAKRRTARAYFGLARGHYLANDFSELTNAVDATLSASPRHVGARVLRAKAAWERQHNEGAVSEDLAAVLEGPARGAASPRELADAWALRAIIEAATGKTAEAKSSLEQGSKLDPRAVDLLVAQGEIASREGKHAEALASFEKALESDPSPVAIAGIAKAKLSLDRISEAKAQLTAAGKDYPKDMRVAYWLARSDEALGNQETAEREYLRAIGVGDAKSSDAALPYAGLTRLLALKGRGKEAETKLEEARAKLPNVAPVEHGLAEGYWQRAIAQRKAGTTIEAIADLKRALELDPERGEIYADLAESYESRNDSQNAFVTWQKALKLNDAQPYWKYRFGRLLLERGTVGEASKHLVFAVDEANKMDPAPGWFVPAQLACAQALQKAGKYADAIEHYRRYLDLSPKTSPERKDAILALSELGAHP